MDGAVLHIHASSLERPVNMRGLFTDVCCDNKVRLFNDDTDLWHHAIATSASSNKIISVFICFDMFNFF